MRFYDLITEGINDKHIFKAVFLIGGPGSGKTTIYKKHLTGFKSINPDDIFERRMKKENASLKKNDEVAKKHRNKSFELIQKKLNIFVEGRLPLVIDRTGASLSKTLGTKIFLESLGYECFLIYVDIDTETALKRNAERERSVPDDYLKTTHKKVKENIPAYTNAFKNFIIINDKEDNVKKLDNWINKPVNNQIAKQWKLGDKK